MANAWDITDATLSTQLEKWRAFIIEETDYVMHLYQNNYTPVPGSTIANFTEADFENYEAQPIIAADWGNVTILNHVASIQNDTPCEFVAGAGPFDPQTVFGYYVTDADGVYLWSERFQVSRVVNPEDTLQVTAVMRHATLPA